jgi:hypothetical protein
MIRLGNFMAFSFGFWLCGFSPLSGSLSAADPELVSDYNGSGRKGGA